MASEVAYSAAGGRGMLFEGKKFWVAQRVPSRSRWIELIIANGGQTVPLEKQADIMIADHARKDAVPGSYSWTWIEQSVKNGILEDLEDHRAGPVAGTSRSVGSSQPTRIARTAFTAADDRALALWVTSAEKQGLSTKGNAIYQQLERINPRHTFQSWRDRWVKYGQFQARPDLTGSPAASSPVSDPPPAAGTKYASSDSAVQPTPASSTHVRRSRELSRSLAPPAKPSKGNPFTEDDRRILTEIYDDIVNIDETRIVEAWEKFAEVNPQHTAQEWYKFWMDDIRPLRTPKRRKLRKRKFRTSSALGKGSSGSQISGAGVRKPQTHPILDMQPDEHRKSSRYIDTQRERFERTLADFAEGQDKTVDFQPTISGRKMQLYDIWNIVKKLEFSSSQGDEATDKWDKLASQLGFDKVRDSGAPRELQELCDWILVDFIEARSSYHKYLKDILDNGGELAEEARVNFENATPPGSDKDEEVEQREEEEYGGNPDVLEIPSSTQRTWPSSDRGHDVAIDPGNEESSSQESKVTPQKRQRVDKGKEKVLEIPSTPEELLSFEGQARETSPVKDEGLPHGQENENEVTEEGMGMFVKSIQWSIFPQTRTLPLKTVQFEPETQDFHFSHAAGEENGTSPSQQVQEDDFVGESNIAVAGSLHEDSSTQSQTDSQREVAELQEFIDRYIALGYGEEVVTEAMLATTLETGDVAVVMESIMNGTGIPENIEGVWTEEDDRAVRQIEKNEEYSRVVLKHGEARCVKRRQFLSEEVLQGSGT